MYNVTSVKSKYNKCLSVQGGLAGAGARVLMPVFLIQRAKLQALICKPEGRAITYQGTLSGMKMQLFLT